MGYFRLLLAISVFLGHAWAVFPPRIYEFAGGVVSVRLFYMISGFLIALVLHSKYHSAINFYKSRMLRLLPVYQITLILTISLSILSYLSMGDPFLLGYFAGYANLLTTPEIILLLIPQFTTIALDLYGFIGINDGGLFLAEQSWKNVNGYQFLLVPQAWTLGLECWFYFLAPFIIRKTSYVVILAIMSLASGILVDNLLEFSGDDPWARRFFPSELKYFLAGVLSFKLKSKLVQSRTRNCVLVFVVVLAATSLVDYISIPIYSLCVYFIFFLSLPSLLKISSRLPFDRIIGDLSYPFYLCHWFILHAVANAILPSFEYPKLSSLLYSILLSLLLVLLIERKIDTFRHRYSS